MPLGLEMAAQLIQDCNYRASLTNFDTAGGVINAALFEDIALGATGFGYNDPTNPYASQKLRNCFTF